MTSELQRLRDRVTELEDLLGLSEDDVSLLKAALPLTPSECRMLATLRKKRGAACRNWLYDVLYGARPECDQPDPKIIEVMISKIRPKLRAVNIEIKTVWGYGYMMEDADRKRLGDMM